MQRVERLYVGGVAELRATWADPRGVGASPDDPSTYPYVDPTTVVCLVTEPDGTETTYTYGTDGEAKRYSYTLNGVSVIEYTFEFPITQPGLHSYIITATGPGAGVIPGGFKAHSPTPS